MIDILVIGAGPAGLTAAIYARRAEKNVLVLEKAAFGGQITNSPKIENYPGMESVSGNELADKMVEHALSLGVEVELEEALSIEDKGDYKVVTTDCHSYEAKSVIIATGAKHRHLGLDGEDELEGNGVSYCAVCDGAFYKGKDVAMIGGGNSALQEAILLSDTCKSVTIVQNLAFLTGETKLQNILFQKKNVKFVYSSIVEGFIKENDELKGILLKNTDDNTKTNLMVDGVFVCIGLLPDNQSFVNVLDVDKIGYAVADESCLTKTKGVFVAGDCRTKSIRQITTANADGAIAALSAIRYINDLNNK